MRRRQLIEFILLFVLLVLLGSGLVYSRYGWQWFRQRAPAIPTTEFSDVAEGVRFRYPQSFQQTAITSEAQAIWTIFRAVQANEALMVVRHERGLGILKLFGGTVLGAITKNLERQYPKEYPGYQKQTSEDVTIGSAEGTRIEFTYTGANSGPVMKQQLVIVVVDDSDAYFFSFQASQDSFATVQPLFETLLNSVEFTEPTVPTSPSR